MSCFSLLGSLNLLYLDTLMRFEVPTAGQECSTAGGCATLFRRTGRTALPYECKNGGQSGLFEKPFPATLF